MEINKDYKFRDDLYDSRTEGETVPIELTIDPYHGVIYRYTVVKFKVGEDEVPKIQYAFQVINPGKFSELTLRKDEYFLKIVGVVLNAMLVELGDVESEDISENRADDNQEPDSERVVHEEGSSVP